MSDDQTLSDYAAGEIRAMLARRRVTGRELAAKLDVSRSWVSYRLTGATEITLNDLQRISQALEVEISDLLPLAARHDERTSGRINERSRPRAARTRAELLHSRPPANRTTHDDRHEPVKSMRGGRHSARPAWTCEGVTA